MRLLSSIFALLFVSSATLSGCDDSKRAKQIVENAVNCIKPSKDGASIVYKQFRRDGFTISESETVEYLDLVCNARIERDPTRKAEMQERLLVISAKLEKASRSISGLLIA